MAAKAIRYFISTVIRETEKAILVRNDILNFDGDVVVEQSVWLPKSQIEVYRQFTTGDKAIIWKVPLWLCRKNNLQTITKKIADMDFGC